MIWLLNVPAKRKVELERESGTVNVALQCEKAIHLNCHKIPSAMTFFFFFFCLIQNTEHMDVFSPTCPTNSQATKCLSEELQDIRFFFFLGHSH